METHGGGDVPAIKIRDHLDAGGKLDAVEIARLAVELSLPEAAVRGIASFYSDLRDNGAEVLVCDGTSCHLAGASRVIERFESGDATCRRVHCLGYCDRSPAVLGMASAPFVGDEVAALRTPAEALPDVRSGCKTTIVTRRLNRRPVRLDAARCLGAYSAIENALRGGAEAVLAAVERSGLRGRGGAGFSTGEKWRICAETPAPQRFVVANGDEGDPGSFIDRVLMEEDPHGIIEGILLCGYAVGATCGCIYIRSEYPRAISVMQEAIREAREAGWLGAEIAGSAFRFDLSVFTGMGSYVCGEESAMLNSIEGLRGEVRLRPPFPAQRGLHGMPTAVNNVETLVNVPYIVNEGAPSFRRLGTNACAGTKAICLNHGFARPGIVEVEFGIPLRSVIEDLGGGARDGRPLSAVLVGGPMGSLVRPADWDVPVCYEAMEKRGIHFGHGGIVALPEGTDFRALLEHWVRFMIDESCGKCVPCRLGSQGAANALRAGRDARVTKARLDEIFTAMEQGSLCAFGQFMPGPMRQILEQFGDRVFAR